MKDEDKTIRVASNHEEFANIFHFLRKACSQQWDIKIDDTTKTFQYQIESWIKFTGWAVPHSGVPV